MTQVQDRPLWIPLYCLEFLGDPKVNALDLEAQAILVRMWLLVARERIPDDPRFVARAAHIQQSKVDLYWADVRAFFRTDEEGHLYSARMERELAKFRERTERQRLGAMKTNTKRWGPDYVPKTPGYVRKPVSPVLDLVPSQSPQPSATTPAPKKPRAPRRKPGEVLTPFSQGIQDFVNETCDRWPKTQPKDGARINIKAGILAENIDSILTTHEGITLDDLRGAVDDYLDPEAAPLLYKAPQYFFGAGGPWKGLVRARLTRKESA